MFVGPVSGCAPRAREGVTSMGQYTRTRIKPHNLLSNTKKRRCWDFMPLNTTKPFATTNICHLVEMISMLGLVWKEFDLKKAPLAAEGNGYMVTSEYVPGLGILTRFSRLSKAEHKENRIVPCEEIKRLCFGEVPSLFDTVKGNLQVSPGRLEHCLMCLLPRLDQHHRKLFLDTTERPPRPLMFPSKFLVKKTPRFFYSSHISHF